MNGSFRREGGCCEIYRKWTCGRESSEGIGLEPTGRQVRKARRGVRKDAAEARDTLPWYPTRKVSNRSFAKLSAWYIMRGLLPTSPSTRIATDRGLGLLLGDRFNSNSSDDMKQNTPTQINWGRVGPVSRSHMRDVFSRRLHARHSTPPSKAVVRLLTKRASHHAE